MSTIIVKVLRTCWHDGRRVEPGATLKLSPLQAHQMVEGAGRAEYVHSADKSTAQAAVRDDVLRQVRQYGRLAPDPGSPWAPAGRW
jgi:hypothetical protein